MTYRELYEKTFWDLQVGDITPEEFEERVKPLNQEPTSAIGELEKIKAEIHDMLKSDEVKNEYWGYLIYNKAYLFINIIDKRISELKGEDK